MPIKHPRDEADIRQLAQELAARWQRGDGVEPWLRSQEPAFSDKVRHQRWSWESIARALNMAGITYETKRPWTGRSLLLKIVTIRFEARLARQNIPAMPATTASPTTQGHPNVPVMAPALPRLAPSTTGGDTPEFKPATLIRHGTSQLSDTPPLLRKEPAPVVDVDAVLARFTGRT